MTPRIRMVALLAGCAGTDGVTTTATTNVNDWHGLEEGASWTYRNAVEGDDVVDDALILARYQGDGLVELRQGSRWPDAEVVGELNWDTSDGLTLTGWSLISGAGSRLRPIAPAELEDGAEVSDGTWSCVTTRNQEVDTFYGFFEQSLQVDCVGDAALGGRWSFAPGLGLVKLDGEWLKLDLVAPW